MLRKIIFSLFLVFQNFLFSQEEEYSTFNFESQSTQKILVNQTKVRSLPQLNASEIDSIATGTEVKIISRTTQNTKIGERIAPWFEIEYGNSKSGYIWGGNIAVGHRKFNDIQFLYGIYSTKKLKNTIGKGFHDELFAKVIAMKNGNIIAEKEFPMGSSENLEAYGFNLIENKNLKNVEVILKAMVSGAACGVPTYEQYFFWTQNQFYQLPRLMLVGDADVFAHSEEFIFPKKSNQNIINLKTEEYEKDENEKEKTKKWSKKYIWDGKSLK